MGFLRKNKTIEDLLPAFLLEREMLANTLTSEAYRSHIYVFVHWLDEATQHYLKVHSGIVNPRIIDNFPNPMI